VSVQKSVHVTFSFAFSSTYAKTRTCNFRKVVWQHTEGMMESIIWILLEIYLSFQQWKQVKISWELTKLLQRVWCTTFLGHSVYWINIQCVWKNRTTTISH